MSRKITMNTRLSFLFSIRIDPNILPTPHGAHIDFALRWLQGISLIAGYELRLSTVRYMPYRSHPLRFSVSITYQKQRKKVELPKFY